MACAVHRAPAYHCREVGEFELIARLAGALGDTRPGRDARDRRRRRGARARPRRVHRPAGRGRPLPPGHVRRSTTSAGRRSPSTSPTSRRWAPRRSVRSSAWRSAAAGRDDAVAALRRPRRVRARPAAARSSAATSRARPGADAGGDGARPRRRARHAARGARVGDVLAVTGSLGGSRGRPAAARGRRRARRRRPRRWPTATAGRCRGVADGRAAGGATCTRCSTSPTASRPTRAGWPRPAASASRSTSTRSRSSRAWRRWRRRAAVEPGRVRGHRRRGLRAARGAAGGGAGRSPPCR